MFYAYLKINKMCIGIIKRDRVRPGTEWGNNWIIPVSSPESRYPTISSSGRGYPIEEREPAMYFTMLKYSIVVASFFCVVASWCWICIVLARVPDENMFSRASHTTRELVRRRTCPITCLERERTAENSGLVDHVEAMLDTSGLVYAQSYHRRSQRLLDQEQP